MEHAGVKILLNARVASATAEGVALAGGGFLRGGTVVCTVGSSPAPILERLTIPKERGRLLTEADMRVRGIYSFERPQNRPVYVGQQVDLFVKTEIAAVAAKVESTQQFAQVKGNL